MDTFEIPTSMLQREHLPSPRARWEEIEPFALTFHGYAYFGSDQCAVVAERTRKLCDAGLLELASLAELRNLLFFTQRAVRHVGYGIGEDDLRVVRETLDALRARVPDVPPASVSDDELRAAPTTSALPAAWFGAMIDGILDEEELLATLLSRVSSEPAFVACACRGLLRLLAPGSDWQVHLEADRRTDLLVRSPDGDKTWAFEWKMLWDRGFKENLAGIRKDLTKIASRERACALAVAFAVHRAPAGCERCIVDVPLETTIRRAVGADALGPPIRRSNVTSIKTGDVEAEWALLAWAGSSAVK